jgi:hypothetical protein
MLAAEYSLCVECNAVIFLVSDSAACSLVGNELGNEVEMSQVSVAEILTLELINARMFKKLPLRTSPPEEVLVYIFENRGSGVRSMGGYEQ